MARVIRSARADEDLIEIWLHVAQDSPVAADRLLDRFAQRWELLATQPRSGRARADLAEDLRQVTIGNYLSFYRVRAGGIEIVRVLHGKRRIEDEPFP
ncbi:MAG: type II toxin-antitoxin system RelE/ParE family toxin [Rhizobiaceae bacterium]|nr:type II toxin-antitoxin system RelE/ParE family toxin [Rhizobiaceae bacterium]MCV0406536.1 type II toxin-antitoxin system RelE/ParE family toxin [Rhizobiaceae bacterium]